MVDETVKIYNYVKCLSFLVFINKNFHPFSSFKQILF